MDDEGDPRIFFASERTLLAWVRTGLAVIGLGFVVARFGLFLRELRAVHDPGDHWGSTLIGVGLVTLGSLAIGMSAWQHARYCRRLPPVHQPRPYETYWAIWFAAILACVGLALAGYLLVRGGIG